MQSGNPAGVLLVGTLLADICLQAFFAKLPLCFDHARTWLYVHDSCYWCVILAKGIRTLVHID